MLLLHDSFELADMTVGDLAVTIFLKNFFSSIGRSTLTHLIFCTKLTVSSFKVLEVKLDTLALNVICSPGTKLP